jgi:hypothetical protein
MTPVLYCVCSSVVSFRFVLFCFGLVCLRHQVLSALLAGAGREALNSLVAQSLSKLKATPPTAVRAF